MATTTASATNTRTAANSTTQTSANRSGELQPVPDIVDYVRDYARQKPEVAAMWCFGIGFVLGWKIKPW